MFARYDTSVPDGALREVSGDTSLVRFHRMRTITAGFGHFMLRTIHTIKFVADLSYSLDPVLDSLVPANANSGITSATQADSWSLRVQLVFAPNRRVGPVTSNAP